MLLVLVSVPCMHVQARLPIGAQAVITTGPHKGCLCTIVDHNVSPATTGGAGMLWYAVVCCGMVWVLWYAVVCCFFTELCVFVFAESLLHSRPFFLSPWCFGLWYVWPQVGPQVAPVPSSAQWWTCTRDCSSRPSVATSRLPSRTSTRTRMTWDGP